MVMVMAVTMMGMAMVVGGAVAMPRRGRLFVIVCHGQSPPPPKIKPATRFVLQSKAVVEN
jgi:hypothetical protein